MKKLNLKGTEKLKPHPIFHDLPERLKDKSCYAPIEKRLADAMFSDHKHATVKGMVRCKRCIAKMQKRQDIMKEEGFSGIAQYLEWKRILSIIISEQDIQLT